MPAIAAAAPSRPVRSRRRLAGLVAAGVAAGALLVPVAGASAFVSNSFQSPTGNIHCAYSPSMDKIACQTMNDSFAYVLGRYGRATIVRHPDTLLPGGPTLSYGGTYTGGGSFRCSSSSAGMTCTSVRSGHGFFISRSSAHRF